MVENIELIERVVLEKLRFGLRENIHPDLLDKLMLKIEKDFLTQEWIAKIRGFVWSKEDVVETIKFPSDWWQAVKERFFPLFLRKKFPVKHKFVVVKTVRTCPHIDFPKDSYKSHIQFLSGKRGKHE